MLKPLAAAAALTVALAGAASAATYTRSATPDAVMANPLATSFSGLIAENTTGSVPGARRSPYEDTAQHHANPYTSITGSARYEFGVAQKALSFVWGSPDTYNSLAFFNNGGKVDELWGFGDGTNVADAFVTVTTIDGGLFDAVEFRSGDPAFEYAGLTTVAAVPVPAAGFLLLSALGAVGVARRRKAA